MGDSNQFISFISLLKISKSKNLLAKVQSLIYKYFPLIHGMNRPKTANVMVHILRKFISSHGLGILQQSWMVTMEADPGHREGIDTNNSLPQL